MKVAIRLLRLGVTVMIPVILVSAGIGLRNWQFWAAVSLAIVVMPILISIEERID